MSIGTGEGGSWPRGPDEHLQDLLPLYALDLLEGREQRAVESHVAKCAQCAETVRELRESLGSLSLAASPVTPPESAREALFERVRRSVGAGKHSPSAGDTRRASTRAPAFWWRPAAGWVTSGALAAAVVVLGWQLATARSELSRLRQEVVSAASRGPLLALAEIDRREISIIPLQSTDTARGTSGVVFCEPDGRIAVVVIDDLPALEAGKVYQLWLIRDSSPVSGGTFRVDAQGVGTLVVNAPRTLDAYTTIGITAEPAPGVPSPTGAIVATASL